MTASTNLNLPYVQAAQAQKHVTINASLEIVDVVLQLSVGDKDLTSPPGSVAEGARFIVASGASGVWQGHADDVAVWRAGAWAFLTPNLGWLAYVEDEGVFYVFADSGWRRAHPDGAVETVSATLDGTRLKIDVDSAHGEVDLAAIADSSLFGPGNPGRVPASGGGTSNFLRADGQWAPAGSAGGLTDGDRGDVTVSGGGSQWSINGGAVTPDKLASVPSGTLRGRIASGRGVVQDLTPAEARSLLGVGAGDGQTAAEIVDAIDADAAAKSALRSAIGVPFRFKTLSDASAATVPGDVALIEIESFAAGTGGAIYARATSQPSHPGRLRTADGAWWEIANPVLDPYVFGASGDGATDDTAELQAMFEACRLLQRDWYIPAARFKVSAVTVYTGGVCRGVLVSTNKGEGSAVVTVKCDPADIETVDASDFAGWGSLFRGSARIDNLSNRKGQFVSIRQDEALIRRNANSYLPQQLGFVVTDNDGNISPPLSDTLTWPGTNTVVSAKTIRDTITIEGVFIELVGSASGERNKVFLVERPAVTLRNCVIKNSTDGGIQQGFRCQNTALVVFDQCRCENTRGVTNTNYGWNSDSSCLITHRECSAFHTRRAIDYHMCGAVRIYGGMLEGGVGAHWANDLVIQGAHVALDYTGGSQSAIPYGGGNLTVKDCLISITGVSRSAISVRGDTYECWGSLVVENNRVIFDNASGDVSGITLVDISGVWNTDPYDPGRTVEMPSYISLSNNYVRLIGSNSVNMTVLHLFSLWENFPQNVNVNGVVHVARNIFDFDGGIMRPDGSAARTTLTILRPTNQIGDGYRFFVSEMEAWYTYFKTDDAVIAGSSRHDFVYRNIWKDVLLKHSSGGGHKTISVFDCGSVSVSEMGGPQPRGDEVVTTTRSNDVRSSGGTTFLGAPSLPPALRLSTGPDQPNVVTMSSAREGKPPRIYGDGNGGLEIATLNGDGIEFRTALSSGGPRQLFVRHVDGATSNVELSGSTGGAPTVGVAGGASNIDLGLVPKGSGLVRFWTNAASANAPNGFSADRYLPVKDKSGNTYYIPLMGSPW